MAGGASRLLPFLLSSAAFLCAVSFVVYLSLVRSDADAALSSSTISVPYLPPSPALRVVGHVRIINRALTAGSVEIVGYDDTGLRHGPVTLSLGAGETVHLDTAELEEGSASKGLASGLGRGSGSWRLDVSSSLDIEVLPYVLTDNGLLSGMHDVVRGQRIAFFNPADAVGQVSRLRLINPGTSPTAVTIEGLDDEGVPAGAVRLMLPAGSSRTVTAEELETGDGEGLSGALGDGAGRWRLVVTSDLPIEVMNLLASSSTGAISNLSSGPVLASDGEDGATSVHGVGFFPSSSNGVLEGVLRIVNRTRHDGRVSMEAIDDTGAQRGPVTLMIGAQESLVINSDELEAGSDAKGLYRGVGSGRGDWRLQLSTSLDIDVLSYVRAPDGDGLLSAMHDLVPRQVWGHGVTLFDPQAIPGQSAQLRLINPSASAASVVIRGVDGSGAALAGEVRLSLAAGSSRTVTASELASGSGSGLAGSLGGAGPWRLGGDVGPLHLGDEPCFRCGRSSGEPVHGAGSGLRVAVGARGA